jgi:hypothetical protein
MGDVLEDASFMPFSQSQSRCDLKTTSTMPIKEEPGRCRGWKKNSGHGKEDKPSKDSSAAGRTEKQTQETWVITLVRLR